MSFGISAISDNSRNYDSSFTVFDPELQLTPKANLFALKKVNESRHIDRKLKYVNETEEHSEID